MASDVLRTGSAFDLNPQDSLVDDNDSAKLAQQHATDILNFQRGEYPLDTSYGMDWLALLQQKRINAAATTEQIRRLVSTIPAINDLSLAGSQSGQTLTVSGNGTFRRFQADAEVLVTLQANPQVGQNGAARFFWRVRG